MGTGQAYANLICSARTRGDTTNDIDVKEQRGEKVFLVGKRKLWPNIFAVVVNTLCPVLITAVLDHQTRSSCVG